MVRRKKQNTNEKTKKKKDKATANEQFELMNKCKFSKI